MLYRLDLWRHFHPHHRHSQLVSPRWSTLWRLYLCAACTFGHASMPQLVPVWTNARWHIFTSLYICLYSELFPIYFLYTKSKHYCAHSCELQVGSWKYAVSHVKINSGITENYLNGICWLAFLWLRINNSHIQGVS